jgi:hypothetical protein
MDITRRSVHGNDILAIVAREKRLDWGAFFEN